MKKYLLIVFILTLSLLSRAQTDLTSQEELKNKAQEYFKDEDYVSAMPLYSQLVSLYSKDPLYNYRFGVCALFADRRDLEKPLKYLLFAASKPDVDDAVYYYLGLTYHQNYMFSEAIKQFGIYKNKAAKSSEKLDVDRQIEICENAKSMLSRIKDIYVLQKTEVAQKDVFRSYDVDRFGGKILVKPDIFKTSLDKKKEKFSLVFFTNGSKEAYFSSYGKDGKNGKDIYKSIKKDDGSWSDPINLGTTVNTKYDEDFPFLLGDGVTLYFSSKGRNTLGGYDIFTSTLDETGAWSTPENLNYPINSPLDDILFVPDSSESYAYFSSNRSSIENLMTVYKVRIDERIEVNETLVLEVNEIGGQTEIDYNQTIAYLKEKGGLEINATEKMFETTSITKTTDNEKENEDVSENDFVIPENISNEDIVKMAETQAKNTVEELKNLKKQKEAAKSISQKRKTQSEEKYTEAQSITESANKLLDQNQKQTEIIKANKLKSEAVQLNRESEIALQISDQLDQQIAIKQKDADDAVTYSKDINKAIQTNNSDSSIAILNRMIDKIQTSPVDTSVVSVVNPSKEFIKKKTTEAAKIKEQVADVQSEADALKTEAETFRTNAQQTKKKTVKEELLKKAEESEAEAKIKQTEADNLLQKTEKILSQIDSANSESVLYADVAADIKSTNNSSLNSVANENSNIKNNTNTDVVNSKSTDDTTGNSVATNNTITNNTAVNNTVTNNSASNNTLSSNNTTENSTSVSAEEKKLQQKIATQTEEISKNLTDEATELRTQSDATYNLANAKYKESVSLKKQADNLISESKEVADDDAKQDYLAKAKTLNDDSFISAQKAYTAFDIAKNLDAIASERENSLDMTSEVKSQISDALKNNQTNKADSLVKELQAVYVEKISSTEKNKQYYSESLNALDAKEYEATNAFEAYQKMETETAVIVAESKKLRQDANNATKPSERKDLMKQAEEKETAALIIKKQTDSAKTVYNTLNREVAALKIKVSYASSLADESKQYISTKVPDKIAIEASIKIIEEETVFAEKTDVADKQENQLAENSDIENEQDNIVETKIEKNDTIAAENNQISINSKNNTDDLNNTNTNNQTAENTDLNQTANNKNNENLNQIAGTSVVAESYSEKEIAQVKSVYIDKSISIVSSEIRRIKTEIATKTDAQEITTLNKTLSDLQQKYVQLKADSEEVSKLSGPTVVLNSKLKISAFELSEIIESEIDSLKVESQALKVDASKQTDPSIKKELLNTAELIDKKVNVKELEIYAVKSTDNNYNYISNTEKINLVKQVENPVTTAELLESEAKYFYDKAQSLKVFAEKNPSDIQKKSILQDAVDNEKKAIEKQEKAIELYKNAKTQIAGTSNNNVANNTTNNAVLNQINDNTGNTQNTSNTNIAANNKINNPNNNLINQQNSTATNSETIVKSGNIADNSKTNFKNDAKIIAENFEGISINTTAEVTVGADIAGLVPLNPVLPEGIIFKVQIAAVRNHLKPEVFKGISPLTGESTGTGLIRYLAGLFVKYEDANSAKATIRSMGYTDAFVVAYYKGKRITVTEALALIKADNSLQNTYAEVNKSQFITSTTDNSTTSEVNSETISNKTIADANANSTTLSNPISEFKGLVYTVQVGVYAKPVTSAQLFDISPLYDEIMTTGMYRYTSGKYNDLASAVDAKNTIVAKGIKDAFVVVYYNGKKITIAEAKLLLTANPDLDSSASKTDLKNKTDEMKTTEAVNSKIIFKVQVGAYKNDIPVGIVNGLLDVVVGNGLEHEQNAEGLTIYTSGTFTDYNKAIVYKNELVAKGLNDAFVVAFQGDEKISVTKAIELLKK